MLKKHKKMLLTIGGVALLFGVSFGAMAAGTDINAVSEKIAKGAISIRKMIMIIFGLIGTIAVGFGVMKIINRSPQDEIGKTIVAPIFGGIALITLAWVISLGSTSVGANSTDTSKLGDTVKWE